MITKVEINGYEITIEENEGLITVRAEKDEEIIEEFSIETEEAQEGEESEEGEGIKSFGDFGGEEEDFGSQEEEEESQEEDEEESELGEMQDEDEEESENKLESFQSFINKKK
jgi:hypothetical protein